MKFIPKEPDDSVNIPTNTHPLKIFIKVVGGATLIVTSFYFILGFIVNMVVPHIDHDTELSLGKLFNQSMAFNHTSEEIDSQQKILQNHLDELISYWPEAPPFQFKISIMPSEDPNAFALPGGNILITSGMIEFLESENTMIMILGHELGHFSNRHHLKSLGRGLLFTLAGAMIFGSDNDATTFLSGIIDVTSAQYSQSEETQADKFGLELLVKKYGHAGGATQFFEKFEDSKFENNSRFQKFLSTHPTSQKRIKLLKKLIHQKGYRIDELVPQQLNKVPQ
ncbi:hypothetical protein BVY03_04405 [bacterium K02(2017)]|nr:hypothetical protein BVY03_04405 [bacterium K02(2017)]